MPRRVFQNVPDPSRYLVFEVSTGFSFCLYEYNKLKPSSYDRLGSTVINHIYPHIGGLKIDKGTRVGAAQTKFVWAVFDVNL